MEDLILLQFRNYRIDKRKLKIIFYINHYTKI